MKAIIQTSFTVEFYNPKVRDEILAWPPGVAASFVRVAGEMTSSGPNLGLPYTRAFGDGLFEIRARGSEGIGRAFFCTLVGRRIMVLHGFIKKTQHTPQAELKLARKRQKEIEHA